MLSRRRAQDLSELAALSEKIRLRLEKHPLWLNSRFPCIYHSMADEADTRALIRGALASGKQVCMPVIEGESGDLKLVEVTGIDNFEPGPFGILEPPAAGRKYVAPESIDLAIVPGIAFDRQGHRLGFGKGYYDRLLAVLEKKPVPALALAFGFQLVERIPTLPHDIRMDLIATESGIIELR